MAYEQFNRFVDLQVERFEEATTTKEKYTILFVLIDYLNTVLSYPRFKSQKQYCIDTITKLNPVFAEGYFKKKKPK